jgi:2'-5' RNA ligase
MSDSVRAFLAIELPAHVRSEVVALQAKLEGGVSPVRWTKPDNLHLTLMFLGLVAPSDLERLAPRWAAACAECPTFLLRLGAIGSFPNSRRAKVLWLGFQDFPATAIALQDSLSRLSASIAAIDDKSFTPHLTIARAPRAATFDAASVMRGEPISVEWRVLEVALIKSDLSSKGPTYTTLIRLPVGNNK